MLHSNQGSIYILYGVPCTKAGKRKFKSVVSTGYCKADYDKLILSLGMSVKNAYDENYQMYFISLDDAIQFAFK